MTPLPLQETQRCVDLDGTTGFLVADAQGRLVGRVDSATYGGSPRTPVALSVRLILFGWRHRLVSVDAIETIDERTRVIGLRINRETIKAFH